MQDTRWFRLTDRPPAFMFVLQASGRTTEEDQHLQSPHPGHLCFKEASGSPTEQFYENLVTKPQLYIIYIYFIFIYIDFRQHYV